VRATELFGHGRERQVLGLQLFKKAQRNGSGGFSGGQKDFRADPAKLRGEAMRSAIHAASSYTTAMAGLGRLPESFTYRQMDPMVAHFYDLIVKAMEER
jgi:hypothetical protein